MADTRIAVGKIKDEPEYFVLLESKQWQVVSKVKKKKKMDQRNQFERTLNGKNQNNMSNKINRFLIYSLKYEISICGIYTDNSTN